MRSSTTVNPDEKCAAFVSPLSSAIANSARRPEPVAGGHWANVRGNTAGPELPTQPAVTHGDTRYAQLWQRAGRICAAVLNADTRRSGGRAETRFAVRPTPVFGLAARTGMAGSGADIAPIDREAGLSERGLGVAARRRLNITMSLVARSGNGHRATPSERA